MKELETSALLSLEHSLARPLLEQYIYPWEALKGLKAFVEALGPTLEGYTEREPGVWVGEDVTIAPTATICPPCIIGPRTEIRPGAFLRGSVLIGEHCVIGNSTELKNALLFDDVQVPHYNYVGDSILGWHAHMGAGSILSNIKADQKNIVVHAGKEEIPTGLRKFGAVLGDYVDLGCNSVLNPGSVIGPRTNLYPLSFVRGYVPADSIYKRQGEIAAKM